MLGVERLALGLAVYFSLKPVGELIGRWGGEIPCASDGSLAFDGVPPDTYTLSPKIVRPDARGGYSIESTAPAPSSRRITLKAGEQMAVTIDLNQTNEHGF